MIKLPEMYRISGGCTLGHTCQECAEYIGGKDLTCIIYPKDCGTHWDGKRIACKYFRIREEGEQMNISDLLRDKALDGKKMDMDNVDNIV